VRYAALFALLLLIGSPARAQETQARIESILNPDKNAASSLQGKSYYGGKSFTTSNSAPVKPYYISEHYSSKEYAMSKSYSGANSFWMGNSKFGTPQAYTKSQYEIPNAGKKADTKTAEVKTASDSGKSYASNNYETREFRGQGKSQKILDQQNADHKPMSIDEVRALLNKNK
jgi:hypothetical protein